MPMDTAGPARDRPAARRRMVAGLSAGTAVAVAVGGLLISAPGVVVDHDLAGASIAAQETG
ncbi:hypothetical protein [Streptomyces sp. NPDC007905]|uniref:hypothetical protein n=1 Tax=Streptomyces sp. NPDC007905 TaxID=3364788 RepID=UPI0036E75D16